MKWFKKLLRCHYLNRDNICTRTLHTYINKKKKVPLCNTSCNNNTLVHHRRAFSKVPTLPLSLPSFTSLTPPWLSEGKEGKRGGTLRGYRTHYPQFPLSLASPHSPSSPPFTSPHLFIIYLSPAGLFKVTLRNCTLESLYEYLLLLLLLLLKSKVFIYKYCANYYEAKFNGCHGW